MSQSFSSLTLALLAEVGSSDNSQPSFYTAQMDLDGPDPDADLAIATAPAHALEGTQPASLASASGAPIRRTHQDYRHAALSVFGSMPSTPSRTPLQSPSQVQAQAMSRTNTDQSHDHLRAGPLISPVSPSFSTPQGTSALPWSPFIPIPNSERRAGESSQGAHDGDGGGRGEDRDQLGPMRGLFVISPPPSAESPGGSSVDDTHTHHRPSFVGQPLVDVRLSSGYPEARREVGEFGEPLRPGPENVSCARGHTPIPSGCNTT